MSNQDDEIISSSSSTFPPLSIITNNIHHDDINNNNNTSNNIINLNYNETSSTPLSLSPSSSISSTAFNSSSSSHHPMHVLTFPRNSSQTLLDIHLHQQYEQQEQQEIKSKRIEIPIITIDNNTSAHSAGGNNNLEVGLQQRTSSTDSMSSSNSSLMNGPPPSSSSLSSLEGIEDKQQQQRGQFNNVNNNNNNNLNINNNNNERSSITLKRQKGNDEKKTSMDRIVDDDHHHGIEHHVDFHIDEDAHHHFENPLLMMSKMNSLPSIESNLSRVASSVPLNADYHSDMESVEEHKANHPAQFFDQQCFMEWKNITFPMGSPKPILKNINGFVAPGKLTAILGPIGSGKSTLLRILSGRGARIYSGDIHINGQLAMNSEKQFIRVDSGRFKSLVSFVARDFTPSNMSLTVHEILKFAVRLKLPSKSQNPLWTTREDRLALLLSSYGLRGKENCLYSALSSGEKRRLTIAVQNVLFHRIVLLEYPTEFMEFGESFLLLKRMKRLADLGVSIIVCLHKPSVQEIEIFDYVSILNKGRQIYFGRPTEINNYFNSIGVRFPHERQNTIAAVLEILLLNDMYNSNNEADKKYAIKHLTDTELKKIDSLDKEYEDRMQSFYIPQKHREELPFLQNTIESIQTEKYYANYWFSILILLQRIYTVKFRNWKTEILSPLLEKIVISVVIGILFLQIDATNMSMKGKIFSFLNLNISLTFGLGLKTLVGQIPNLMQERNSTSYRISAFFIAKSIEDTIDFTIYPTVFGITVYFMCGLGLDPARIFSFILIFALFNLTSMSVAQALASLIPLPSFLNFISPVISLVFILVSSAYGITKTDYINWMGYFSYLYYAFRALAINEFSGVIINVAPNQNGTIVIPAGHYTNGTLFLEKAYGITEPYYMMWVYTVILFLYFILCKILAYVGLRFVYGKKSPKRTLQNILSHFKSCCKK